MANNWTSATERYNYYGLIAPTDMQMNWIGADLLRVQWNDIYHTDYDGQPVGNPPEIGAYEYV